MNLSLLNAPQKSITPNSLLHIIAICVSRHFYWIVSILRARPRAAHCHMIGIGEHQGYRQGLKSHCQVENLLTQCTSYMTLSYFLQLSIL